MSQVVMIDNELARIAPWFQAVRDALGEAHVELILTVDAALARFDGGRIDLLVWDLMMPRGSLDERDTQYSTRTGEVLYERFRARWPRTPAILLTNVLDHAVLAAYAQPPLSRSARKRDLGPDALVALVRECLGPVSASA